MTLLRLTVFLGVLAALAIPGSFALAAGRTGGAILWLSLALLWVILALGFRRRRKLREERRASSAASGSRSR